MSIEKENFRDLEFVELNACNGGCVGGALTVENAYMAKARLQTLRRYLPVSLNHVDHSNMPPDFVPDEMIWDSSVDYTPVTRLHSSVSEARKKMAKILSIRETLCSLDCGSCGAPTCQALAEDIVNGEADLNDCVINMKNKLNEMTQFQNSSKNEEKKQ